jgi:signal transduction histidine kinase
VVTPRRGLAAWPIRRKLIALVTGPLVLLLTAGVLFTAQSVTALRGAQRARDLANAALLTNQLTSAMNNEMQRTLLWRDQVSSLPLRTAMTDAQTTTDQAYKRLAADLGNPPDEAWTADVETARTDLSDQMSRLSFVRRGAARTNGRIYIQSQYVQKVRSVLSLMAALTKDLSSNAPNPATIDAASAIAALALASDAAAQESVRLTTALEEGRLSNNTQQNLLELKVTQSSQLDVALNHATPTQRSQIQAIRTEDPRLDDFRRNALALLATTGTDAPQTARDKLTAENQAKAFSAASWDRVRSLDAFVNTVTATTRDQANATSRDGLFRTGLISSLAVLGILLGSALVTYVTRTVTVPMRRLRAGAVDAAAVRLPAMVRQIEREGSGTQIVLPPVLPPGTVAGPETLEVAQAVDGLTAEAVRLATAQVRLRHALDEAFVSMSRRSQSMVEKQLAIIDELESTEEDPDQLRNLFRLDHLAARMRRYNDNLLVLAGSTLRTRSAAPVPIADVFRAATSEMEQYERVRLQPVNGVSVSGPVAGGLVHLLAELLDNAAMYSPPTSPILLSGTLTPDGGLHLEITDSGVGIPASELADLNSRLATPGSIDTQVPSRMGLYVVARLAQRGSFAVRLSPRPNAAGTVAEVDVPATMVVGAGRPGQPGQPGQGPGGSPRPDAPRVPGQPLTGSPDSGRTLAPTGGMRLDPALRLTSRPGGTTSTSPRGIPAAPGRPGLPDLPGSPGTPATPLDPAAAASPGPVALVPPAGADPSSGAPGSPGNTPPARTANGSPGGLPSRRPGAALAGNPLVSRPAADQGHAARPGFEAFGTPAAGTGPATGGSRAAAAIGGVAAARAGLPPAAPSPGTSLPPAGLTAPSMAPPRSTPGAPSAPGAPAAAAAPPIAPEARTGTPPGQDTPGGPGITAPSAPGTSTAPETGGRAPSAPAAPLLPPAAPLLPPAAPLLPPAASPPAAPAGPRFEAPQTSDLPRRTRGTALAGTPLAGPPPVPTPLNGIDASRMFGSTDETGPDETGGALPGGEGSGPGTPLGSKGMVPSGPDRAPQWGTGLWGGSDGTPQGASSHHDTPGLLRDPFAQQGPASGGGHGQAPGTGLRPPYRPGATSAQAGASAATAAAAAARARAAARGRAPTPGTGLFAATGPATMPAGIGRSLGPGAPFAPVGPSPSPPAAPAGPPPAPGFSPPREERPREESPREESPQRHEWPEGRNDGLQPGSVPVTTPESALTDFPQPSRPSFELLDHEITATEFEARAAASLSYRPAVPDAPMIGIADSLAEASTPIFDSISVWFATPPADTDGKEVVPEPPLVIDLRGDVPAAVGVATAGPGGATGQTSRWAALGDQRWLATNARAASAPEIAGNTEAGLPRRQPGANLLPSAVEAAPANRAGSARPGPSEAVAAPAAVASVTPRPDADVVRGRLGSYQRGLTTARRARHLPGSGSTGPALGGSESRPQDAEHQPSDQGGNQ